MTKEIIIDGIDVSECGFFHPKYDTDCHIALAFSEEYEGCMKCENNPNCYFKQFKRAEQNAKDTYEMWQASLDSLKIAMQELSDTKQKLEKIKEYFYFYIETEDHIKTDILKIIKGEN